MIINQIPGSNEVLRQKLYDGALLIAEENLASMSLVKKVRHALIDKFGEDYRQAPFQMETQEFFTRLYQVRRRIYTSPEISQLVWAIISTLGFNQSECSLKPLGLRVIMDGGHHHVPVPAVYHCHRDTWYALSQSHLVWWIPLDDLSEEETFVFYPECYRVAIPNEAKIFDDPPCTTEGRTPQETYPTLLEPSVDLGKEQGFSCQRGQNIVFAAAHLHRTVPQSLGTTRFSLDFRLVHIGDYQQGIGAPNVDNH